MENFFKNNWVRLIFVILGVLLIILLVLIIFGLLGYHYNKNFISDYMSFDKQQCIDTEYPTYYHHSGIAGCIFWMRADYLEKNQNWQSLFKRDDAYCNQKYSNGSNSLLNGLDELNDSKCEYEGFKMLKVHENWAFLISTEKDGMYNYCVGQTCHSPAMFK
jgi:hypothetical protein